MKQYNVLSLFGGVEVGYQAILDSNLKEGKYYSAEICPNAIKVAQDNFKEVIHIGDVTKVNVDNLDHIDILFAGFPCQTVSLANQGGKDINTGSSSLVFELHRIYLELKAKNPNLIFLIENVRMSEANRNVVNRLFGVQPTKLNSNKVSIQNRERLYWTNIELTTELENKGLYLRDFYCKEYDESLILKGKGLNKLGKKRNRAISINSDKSPTLMKTQDKLPTDAIVFEQDGIYRYPTRRECELMQTMPIGFTKAVNYRVATGLMGNSWTKDIIVHFLNNIK